MLKGISVEGQESGGRAGELRAETNHRAREEVVKESDTDWSCGNDQEGSGAMRRGGIANYGQKQSDREGTFPPHTWKGEEQKSKGRGSERVF